MFQRVTTILILTAITIQAVFSGLQNSVSICLGGGHEHGVAEVVEHCDMECTHHSTWPTPIASVEDIDGCACTDLELNLISLLTNIRNTHECNLISPSFEYNFVYLFDAQLQCALRGPPETSTFDIPAKRQQLVALRSTRLLL